MFDDAFPTLDWLRDRGVRIGCVTNRVFGGPRFAEELRELGLDRYFESTAVSCDFGYMKPHPQDLRARPREDEDRPGGDRHGAATPSAPTSRPRRRSA